MTSPVDRDSAPLVVGYGLHGQAVVRALQARGIDVVVVDDRPTSEAVKRAAAAGVELVQAPAADTVEKLVRSSTHLLPTPGLPDSHQALRYAVTHNVVVVGEFDLAAQWDARPVLAITGTNGKTTVTSMVTDILLASGRRAVSAGNMELPLVSAIDDPNAELFVVEASSFRLGHSSLFAPVVAAWLNFEADHLDVHSSLNAYESAKARIWRNLGGGDVAVANSDDAVVMSNLPSEAAVTTFGSSGDARVQDHQIVVGDTQVMPVSELHRALPHDITNALAASAVALGGGATPAGAAEALRSFVGLQHRLEFLGEARGVRWFNDSKATTPHAVLAGLGGFDSVVLIAGGRNKGVDLAPLKQLLPRLRAVVGIGEAAEEIQAVFEPHARVVTVDSMQAAVQASSEIAESGDVVALSPACTSYDWYPSYAARGEDFTRLVRLLLEDL